MNQIKVMQRYRHVEQKVNNELAALGLMNQNSIQVEDIVSFDQFHYWGTTAVEEVIKALNIKPEMKILDIGSGIGGPARYLAWKTNSQVTALELQEDLHQTALKLTNYCQIEHLVEHLCGDILTAPGKQNYDILVSWLVFLHIVDRHSLFKQCYNHLKAGGKIYIEDYYKRNQFTAQEKDSLKNNIYCNYLPTLEEYQEHLLEAGFKDIEIVDQTDSWSKFVRHRLEDFQTKRERNLQVHGAEIVEGMTQHYTAVSQLFGGGNLGGVRIIASTSN